MRVSDPATIVLAVAVVLGAAVAHPVSLWIGAAGALLGLVARWPILLVFACALLASGLAARAEGGAIALRGQRYSGWVTLLGDPAPVPGGVEVVVRMGRRHVDLWAHGDSARAIDDLLAGERVAVAGVVRPVPAGSRERDAHRHVVGRLTVDHVLAAGPASPLNRAANWVHRTLSRGAQILPPKARALYLGFVVGDRRGVDDQTAARFEASGLTHLLAVSGENVAFVLAAASPLLRRLRLHSRAIGAIGVIAFFATVTRFEPSVLRASAMAGLAAVAQASGRPASGLRLLALAAAGLVLVDPFLIWSVGFRLSVGASLGILLLAAPLTRRCPGPRWLAEALGVTSAAQIGVAPIAIPVFGSIPLAALPANLLVAPVVGPLMMWGVVAGLPAGVLGERAARILHWPTGFAIGWVDGVARMTAALPAVAIDARVALGACALALTLGAVWIRRRWRRLGSPPWRWTSAVVDTTSPRDPW
jgi:competence protein ComEC